MVSVAPDLLDSSPVLQCPVCKADRTHRAFVARDPHYGIAGAWQIRQCEDCESLFVENIPSEESLARMYPDTYYSFAIPHRARWKRMLRRLLGYQSPPRDPAFPVGTRMLDFGCGAGEWLLERRAEGMTVFGVEQSASAREAAAAMGVDVRAQSLGAEGFAAGSFDYVRSNHALEHVRDPERVLRDLYALLKPGGTLFVGVPTSTSQNARLFGRSWWYLTPPIHPLVFSTKGIVDLVRKVGFSNVRTWTNGDHAGLAGSIQIRLNEGTTRASNRGLVFWFKPFLVLSRWLAKLQDALGTGDKLELVAVRPAASSALSLSSDQLPPLHLRVE